MGAELASARLIVTLTLPELRAEIAGAVAEALASTKPANDSMGELYDVHEAAQRLRCSERHLRHLIKLRRIAVVRAGRGSRIRIAQSEIDRYLRDATQPAVGAKARGKGGR